MKGQDWDLQPSSSCWDWTAEQAEGYLERAGELPTVGHDVFPGLIMPDSTFMSYLGLEKMLSFCTCLQRVVTPVYPLWHKQLHSYGVHCLSAMKKLPFTGMRKSSSCNFPIQSKRSMLPAAAAGGVIWMQNLDAVSGRLIFQPIWKKHHMVKLR